jgi:excisionase family DNA binding protein
MRTLRTSAAAAKVEWLNLQAAAEALGVSPSSVRNYAKSGEIKVKAGVDPQSNQPIKMYHAGDIERVRHERENPQPKPEAREVAVVAPQGKLAPLPVPLLAAPEFVEEMPLALWLTIAQAAEYLGFPEADIEQWILAGKLRAYDRGKGRRNGRWRISRKTLDSFEG